MARGWPNLRSANFRSTRIDLEGNVAKGPASKPWPNRNGAMRRLTNRILAFLALALIALGVAAQFGLTHVPVPPLAFLAVGAICALSLGLRNLPTRARRPIVFLVVLVLLAALTAGLAYFQFAIKPNLVKGFISAAFAPKPTAVAAEAVKTEKWPPRADGDWDVARLSGRPHRAAGRGRGDRETFRVGRRRRSRRAAHQYRRFRRAGRPRQRPGSTEERRCDVGSPKDACGAGQYPAIDRRHGARDPQLGRGDR